MHIETGVQDVYTLRLAVKGVCAGDGGSDRILRVLLECVHFKLYDSRNCLRSNVKFLRSECTLKGTVLF